MVLQPALLLTKIAGWEVWDEILRGTQVKPAYVIRFQTISFSYDHDNLDKNVKICAIYNPPTNSRYHNPSLMDEDIAIDILDERTTVLYY